MPIPLLIESSEDQQLACTIKSMVIGPFEWYSAADFGPNPVEIRQSQRKEVGEVVVGTVFAERDYQQVYVEDEGGGVRRTFARRNPQSFRLQEFYRGFIWFFSQ